MSRRNCLTISFLSLYLLLSFTAAAAEGDKLTIIADSANLRNGPSWTAPVLLELKEGRSLVEIGRDDRWIEVATGRENVQSGWIYSELVRKAPEPASGDEDDNKAAEQELFDLFKRALAEYNKEKNRESGYAYFIEPDYAGNGVIVVTGTKPWLKRPMEQRMEDLSEVFEIWAAAVGEGPPITINVVDLDGEKQMTMYR